MRNLYKKIIVSIMVLAMLLPLLSTTMTIETQANLRQMRDDLRAIQSNIRDTQADIAATDRALTEAEREMYLLDQQIMALMYDIMTLADDLILVEERLEQAVKDLAAAREYHATQEAFVHERLRELHEHGQINILDVLVQSNSVRDFMLRVEFMRRIAQQDQNMLLELEAAEVAYLSAVYDVSRQRRSMESLMNELERTSIELDIMYEEWQNRHEQLTADRLSFADALAAYQAQARTAQQIIADEEARLAREAELERQRRLAEAQAQLRGELVWPVPGFFSISSPFGMRANPFNRRQQQMHHGIDIAESGINGAPVVAAADGVVIRAATGWNSGFGTVIFLEHVGGMVTVYAHLSALQVREGEIVRAGQTIGTVGSTGNSTGPHLHFEVRHGNRRVDPMPYLRGR